MLHRLVTNCELCFQAVQDDASGLFVDIIRDVGDRPKKAPVYETRVSTTLYNHSYLAMVMDEAHVARKLNKIHTAAYALRAQSACMVAMTATPVMNKLQVGEVLHASTSLFDHFACRIYGSWDTSWKLAPSQTSLRSIR